MGGTISERVGAACRSAFVGIFVVAVASFVGILSTPSLAANANDYSVIAGGGSGSVPSVTGTASTSTSLNDPEGVVVDPSGNLLICDTNNNEIEVLATSASNPGYTLATGVSWVIGNLYVIVQGGDSPATPSIAGTSGLSTELNTPTGLGLDAEGNVIISDTGVGEVLVLAVSATNPGYEMTSWTRGNVYVVAGNGSSTPTPTSAGSSATTIGLIQPTGVAIDHQGNILVSDSGSAIVAVVAVSASNPGYPLVSGARWTVGDLYPVAGGGSQSPSSSGSASMGVGLGDPAGLAIDESGNVAIADVNDNEVDLLAISATNPGFAGVPTWSKGDLYTIAGSGTNAPTNAGANGLASVLQDPQGIAFDRSGDVLIADTNADGIDVLAETGSGPGFPVPSNVSLIAGDLYLIAGGGTSRPTTSAESSLAAQLNHPFGIAAAEDGELYIADTDDRAIDEFQLAPSAPTLLSATANESSVQLTWS
ncbi:MAG: hypothetical protein WB770_07290, partial [Acidimicrobiales bacterium]